MRDFVSELSKNGCIRVRTKGSHETWITANGHKFVVVKKKMVSRRTLIDARDALLKEGKTL